MNKILLLGGALALSTQAATVTVTATPSSTTFAYQIGATKLPAAQTVTVKASSGAPTFTATTPAPDLWVTVGPASGTVPGTLTVRVNPTSLAARTYSSSVTITVSGVAPVTVPVTLVVTPAPSTLTLSATTLNFVSPPASPAAQSVSMSTDGAPISFTVTSGATWLTVTTLKGVSQPDVVTAGEEYPLSISVNAAALAPQLTPYVGKITVVASGAAVTVKSQTISVSLTVNSSAPTITAVWPPTLPVNGAAQAITIYGTNFYSATVAEIMGVSTALATTPFTNSSTFLQAIVPASMLTAPATLKVLVSNPAPGGNSATFNVTVANTAAIGAVVNAASYASGTVAGSDIGTVSPGELVTIFGANLAPTTPALMSITAGGFVDTASASGVSATVDGKPAPLIYVSETQISVQIPYEVAIGAGKVVLVTNGANPAVTATVTTAATAPGLFTADGSGTGQAAALNYGATTMLYTLNSSTNLAKIGDTVILYLTGEGIYDTLSPLLGGVSDTGFVIPPGLTTTPQVNPLPTVSIGGVDASAGVAYAGPVVGSIIGVLQINVVVPVGSTTGTQVPVSVTIGGNPTQAGITLAIHP
jgi:uncharacterized protein (TIGR03437 family)